MEGFIFGILRYSCLQLRPCSVLGSFGVVLMSWRGYFHVGQWALQISIVYYVQIRMIYKHIYLYYLKEYTKEKTNLHCNTIPSCRWQFLKAFFCFCFCFHFTLVDVIQWRRSFVCLFVWFVVCFLIPNSRVL